MKKILIVGIVMALFSFASPILSAPTFFDFTPTESDMIQMEEAKDEYHFYVRPGDTLWELMNRRLNAGERFTVLDVLYSQTNDTIRGFGISSGNMDLIYPGEEICFHIDSDARKKPFILLPSTLRACK